MSPIKPSRYDELHDRYEKILTAKAGTRYERLAALVFKALDEQSVVIHDLKLAGTGKGVQHQIDVTIDQAGTQRRILLECKDFDLSGSKIGLGIARDFRSAIEDTGADEGWMVTCVGFTKDAAAYAKSKGIKLLVLRAFEDKDMEGRIQQINVGLKFIFPVNHDVTIAMDDPSQAEFARQLAAMGSTGGISIHDPVYVVSGDEREHINEFISRAMNAAVDLHNEDGCPEGVKRKFSAASDGKMIQVVDGPLIPFFGVLGTFEIGVAAHDFEVVSDRIAELLLKGFGSEDMIIFGDQLERFTIDAESGAAQIR